MFCCVLAVIGSQAKRTHGEELPEKSLGFSKQRERWKEEAAGFTVLLRYILTPFLSSCMSLVF